MGYACNTGWNSTDCPSSVCEVVNNRDGCEYDAVMQSRNNIGEEVLHMVAVLGGSVGESNCGQIRKDG